MLWMNKSSYEQELARTGVLTYVTRGSSMRPFIRSGEDLVQLRAKKPGERFSKYDVVLYHPPGGEYILHRIVKVLPDSYVLCGDNRVTKEPDITDDIVLAVLTGIVRKGKSLNIHSRGYRFVLRCWYTFFGPRVFVMKVLYRLKTLLHPRHTAQGGAK